MSHSRKLRCDECTRVHQKAPPALMRGGEPFGGHSMLGEGGAAEVLVIWQTLRDTTLWAVTPKRERRKLFAEGAEQRQLVKLIQADVDTSVKAPLLILSGVLGEKYLPADDQLASACLRITEWAEDNDRPQTAIAFANTAAMLLPFKAENAYRVGLLCRRNAEYDRAETWFRRAIGLAVRRDYHTYALSYIGLGNIYLHRGDYVFARAVYLRALRTARRKSLRSPKVIALHDLFSIAVEQAHVSEAESFAQEAYRAYKPTDRRFPAFAHDVAAFWMLQGFFDRAHTVFQAVLPLISRPAERLLVLSNIARAAAGAGRRVTFLESWIEAWAIIDQNINTERACSGLVNLAHGAAMVADWERAEAAAHYAHLLSSQRGEAKMQEEAQELLTSARAQRSMDPISFPVADTVIAQAADVLAAQVVVKLAACAENVPLTTDVPPRTLW